MQRKVLNYRIIIEPEEDPKTGKKVYTAFCPKLGVGDWGKTMEEALEHIREGIQCHLESLAKQKKLSLYRFFLLFFDKKVGRAITAIIRVNSKIAT